jgi:hypothetical protein
VCHLKHLVLYDRRERHEFLSVIDLT